MNRGSNVADHIKIKNNQIKYLRFGSGPRACVILPGLSMVSVLMNASHHERMYAAYSATHTVYLIDRPDFLPDQCTIREIAEMTAECMHLLGIENADILGISMGGMIAQLISCAHPELVRSMVLVSSSLSVGSPETLKSWIDLAADAPGNVICEKALRAIHGPLVDEDDLLNASRQMIRWEPDDRKRFLILAKACLAFDGRKYASGIHCPALVIGAAGDRLCPVSSWKELADTLGAESFLYGKDYGHAVYTEAPDFRERVLKYFLRDTGDENIQYDDSSLIWKKCSEQQILDTPVFRIFSQREESADGFAGDYVAMKCPDWVMIVPDLGEDFILVRQWRHGYGGLTTEFPGGVCDPGEDVLKCAARELEEETGYVAGKMSVLGACCPNPALQDNRVTICLAEDLTYMPGRKPDADERICVRMVSKRSMMDQFASGDYIHALTGLALFLYQREYEKRSHS